MENENIKTIFDLTVEDLESKFSWKQTVKSPGYAIFHQALGYIELNGDGTVDWKNLDGSLEILKTVKGFGWDINI